MIRGSFQERCRRIFSTSKIYKNIFKRGSLALNSTDKPIKKSPRRPPATTPEARENQMVSLAIDLAEKQLAEGTASSQVITHFLKLGSIKERKELTLLEQEIELKKAKTESIQSAKRIEELYINALNAMRTYSGNKRGDEDEDEEN